ncbi:multidrug effflux MFS transporter [Eilatimonas milleporae]|uniref:Bcr/CflA family efflux transporter n=1 Tax=Eilatimonas milleporae TaxID=911205 RepID=A0A3M0C101_9PROT|nr:multidrug effflux MFS transporter [Eilatimonas milleporae]RMB02010.1 DHA1 family bicyclomycin/chloramphenicol resistance-like MFS transporter [Eilatimonas milleporae]
MEHTAKSTRAPRPVSSGKGVIALLAGLSAAGQIASNIYLPSLPDVAADLAIDQAQAQSTYSIYLAVFAVSQLFYGPISDRFGRRSILAIGLMLYVLGSALCAFAASLDVLLLGRAIQAGGAGAAVVLARAIVRDSFEGPRLTRVLALVTILFALAPAMSPLLGGVIQQQLGWHAVFWVTAAFGVLLMVGSVRLPETNMNRLDHVSLGLAAKNYSVVLRDPQFIKFGLVSACAIAAMSAFFGGSPAVFIDQLGLSPIEYGLYPPIAVSGFVVGSMFVRRRAEKHSLEELAMIGVMIMLAGALLSIALPVMGIVHKHGYNAGIILTVTGLGVLMPSAVAGALAPFKENAGSASAMLGFLQMGAGGVAVALVSAIQNDLPLIAYPVAMVGAAALGLLILVIPRRAEVSM